MPDVPVVACRWLSCLVSDYLVTYCQFMLRVPAKTLPVHILAYPKNVLSGSLSSSVCHETWLKHPVEVTGVGRTISATILQPLLPCLAPASLARIGQQRGHRAPVSAPGCLIRPAGAAACGFPPTGSCQCDRSAANSWHRVTSPKPSQQSSSKCHSSGTYRQRCNSCASCSSDPACAASSPC